MKDLQQRWCCFLMVTCMVVLGTTQSGMGLVLSEIMYHPADEGETLEFIELYNNRAVFEDLTGYAFTNGIRYVFEPGTIINSGQYLVVARDPASMKSAYPLSNVLGPFTGRLGNDGERIDLSNNNGEIIISLRYDDERPWPVSPDGAGHSLLADTRQAGRRSRRGVDLVTQHTYRRDTGRVRSNPGRQLRRPDADNTCGRRSSRAIFQGNTRTIAGSRRPGRYHLDGNLI